VTADLHRGLAFQEVADIGIDLDHNVTRATISSKDACYRIVIEAKAQRRLENK
jgi:hypothetical protein